MSITLMLNYARSGGTLLNKCLASISDVVMLSEVNPLGGGWGILKEKSPTTVKAQAKEWYEIDIKNDGFREGISELSDYCSENRKHLIIRDWSFVNFSGHVDNNNNPIGKFLSIEEMQDFDVKPFVFVRDIIDVWISRNMPDISTFAREYLNFLNEVIKLEIKIFKYEDFVKRPEYELESICNYIGIEFQNVYPECLNYDKVNGDTQIKTGSRGIIQQSIKQLPRKKIPFNKIMDINDSMEIREANKLMGYPEGYFKKKLIDKVVFKLNYFLPKILHLLVKIF